MYVTVCLFKISVRHHAQKCISSKTKFKSLAYLLLLVNLFLPQYLIYHPWHLTATHNMQL